MESEFNFEFLLKINRDRKINRALAKIVFWFGMHFAIGRIQQY
jgi:hypothetical protein